MLQQHLKSTAGHLCSIYYLSIRIEYVEKVIMGYGKAAPDGTTQKTRNCSVCNGLVAEVFTETLHQ